LLAIGIAVSIRLVLSSRSPPAHEGFLHRFTDGKLCGYLDDNGAIIVAPTFKYASTFSDGLGMTVTRDGRLGFIDATGRTAIPHEFKWSQGFYDGLARVTTMDGRCGFIDHGGKMVFEIDRHALCARFSGGLAAIGLPKRSGDPASGCTYGYLNRNGKLAIPPRFDRAEDFYNGYAAVRVGEKWGLIDTTGRLVMEPMYESIATWVSSGYEDGLIPVRQKRLWGAADISGKLLIAAKYKRLEAFRGGLACAQDSSGKFGYIDTQGDWAIPPTFDWASPLFDNGRAAVWVAGRHIALIDTEGKTVSTVAFTPKLSGRGRASHGVWEFSGTTAVRCLLLRADGTVLWPKR